MVRHDDEKMNENIFMQKKVGWSEDKNVIEAVIIDVISIFDDHSQVVINSSLDHFDSIDVP